VESLLKARNGQSIKVKFGCYESGCPRIDLIGDDGEPFATATINMPEMFGNGCVAIKDCFESEGVVDFLLNNGVLKPEKVGMVNASLNSQIRVPVYMLTDMAYVEFFTQNIRGIRI
jgi:hypothetical protein